MFKHIPKTALRTRLATMLSRGFRAVLFVVALTGVFLYTRVGAPVRVEAATSSQLNFQARLLDGAGAIVPDGNYNVEFKLYDALTSSGSSQGSCSGDTDCLWTETYTSTKVTVKAGYLSVHLGSLTPFPNTINWDQDLYLGMNVGGTGTASWDGEMTPRLQLTAVPYAMRAGGITLNNAGHNGNLSFGTVANDPNIKLPDIAGTNNLLLQSGTTLFTQGSIPFTTSSGLLTEDNANFYFDGANHTLGIGTTRTGAIDGTGSARLVVKGSGSSSATSSLNVTDSSDASLLFVRDDGNVGIGTTAPGARLEVDAAASGIGAILKANATTPGNLLELQNSAGDLLSGFNSNGDLIFRDQTSGFTAKIVLEGGALSTDVELRIPQIGGTHVGEICTSAGNCLGNGGAGDIFNGGQNGPVIIGTDDATLLTFQTDDTDRFQINGTGTATVLSGDLAVGVANDTTGTITLYNDSSAYGAILQSSALTQQTVFSLPNVNFANATICVKYDNNSTNCAGSGSSVTQDGTNDDGQVAFFTTSNNITSQADYFFDATNTRLGIGDGSPDYRLEVQGSSGSGYFAVSNAVDGDIFAIDSAGDATLGGDLAVNGGDITSSGALTLTPNGGDNLNVVLSGTGDFAVNTNQLYVDTSTGFVGIGTTGPSALLHAAGDVNGIVNIKSENTNDGANALAMLNATSTSGTIQVQSFATGYTGLVWGGTQPLSGYGRVRTNTTMNGLILEAGNTTTGNILFATGDTERLRIESNGNVGIGDTSPDYKLEVQGSSGTGYLAVSNAADGDIFAINSSGQVSIGTNSVGTDAKLTVNANGTTDNTASTQLNAGAADQTALVVQGFSSQTADLFEVQNASGVVLASIDYNGRYNYGSNGVAIDGAPLSIQTVDPAQIATILRVMSGQTGDFFQLQDDTGTPLTVFNATGYLGIGDTTPAAPLTVGNGDLFQINASGDITTASGEILNINTGSNASGASGAINLGTGTGTTSTGGITIATGDASAGTAGNITIDNGASNTGTPEIHIGTADQTHTIQIGTASGSAQALLLGSSNTGSITTLSGGGGIKVTTLLATTSDSYAVCRDASSFELTACDTNTTGTPFVNGGNSFGTTTKLGTNDAQDLIFRTNNGDRLTLTQAGNLNFLQASTIGTVSSNQNFSVQADGTGTLSLDTGGAGTVSIGTANASAVSIGRSGQTATFNGNVVVAAQQTLRLVGGTTAQRPGSPSEGTLYYDTDTHQLLTYNGTKWISDRAAVTKIVAANNSSQAIKDAADYVADGTADETEINAALTAAAGGKVYLAEGTYVLSSNISVPNNTTLAGAGRGTLIELADLDANATAIVNADTSTGTGVNIQDLRLDGRSDLNTAGSQFGISFLNMGGGTGASTRKGSNITNVIISRFRNGGIVMQTSSNNTISNNTIVNSAFGLSIFTSSNNNTFTGNILSGNANYGMYISGSSYNVFSGNTLDGNLNGVATVTGTNNSITGNTISNNTGTGIALITSSTDNTVTGNKVHNTGGSTGNNGIYIDASDSNDIVGNSVTDTSCTTTCYAIYIFNSTSDTNYLADNTLGGGTINDVGTGTIYGGQLGNSNIYTIQGSNGTSIVQNAVSGGQTALNVAPGNHTAVVAETKSLNVAANTLTVTTGYATQRFNVFNQSTLSVAAGQTITDAATLAVSGAPVRAGSGTVTNTYGLLIQSGAVGSATNSYGLAVNAQTGATNNYAAIFMGGRVGVGDTSPDANFDIDATFTPAAAGTTVNTGSGLTVTNTSNKNAATTDTTYGQQITVTRTGVTNAATINTYGLDIQATGDTGGTSTLTGINVNVSGADNNYAAIFQGGNVGIGSAAPTNNLYVQTGVNGGGITISGVGSNIAPAISFAREGTIGGVIGEADDTSAFFGGGATSIGDLAIRARSGNDILFGNGDQVARVVIQDGGNVGIGDVTPAALLTVGNGDKFQVDGNGDVTTVNGETLNINTGTTGDINIDTGTTGDINIGTGSNDKDVAIGSTNSTSSVIINTGTGTANGDLNIDDNTVNNKRLDIGSVDAAGSTTVNIATNASATQAIQVGGNFTNGGSNASTTVKIQGGATGLQIADSGATLQTFTNSATAFQILTSSGGGSPLLVADTANTTPRILIGNPTPSLSTAALVVTTGEVTTTLRIGNATNAVLFNDTSVTGGVSGKLRFIGTARNDINLTLIPEFEGGTLTGDGSSNIGVMTSDFCSGASSPGRNINASACGATNEHNFYQWTTTQGSAQDYDIFIRYQLPANVDTVSPSFVISASGYRSTSNDSVTMTIYDSDDTTTPCVNGSNLTPSNGWNESTSVTLTGCTFSPNTVIVFRLHMTATNGNFARMGEINVSYKANF